MSSCATVPKTEPATDIEDRLVVPAPLSALFVPLGLSKNAEKAGYKAGPKAIK